MKLKALLLALFVAGVTASFAVADDGHGSSGEHKKGNEHAALTTTTTTGTTAKHDGEGDRGKSTKCRPSIELELRGTVAAAPSATALAVLVGRGGAQGASLAGKQLTLDVTGLKQPATLNQGDNVRVHARACVDLVAGTVKLVATKVDAKKDDGKTTSSTATTTSTTTTTTAR